jgi:periplasmic protein TonB
MHDAVSQALYGRSREPQGSLTRMISVSAALHVGMIVLLVFVPAHWWQRPLQRPANVMTISLGGAPGPRSGGMTSISSRPVQQAVADLPKVTPNRPPAAKTPEMVEPIAKPKPAKETPTPIRDAPKDSNTRKPSVGAQTQEGTAKAETGATTNSIGLSTGGGGTGGQINVGNFCCPEYIAGMVSKVHQNWNSRQSSGGITTMQFTINRDGTLTNIQVLRSSGNQMLDFLANRALLAVRQLPPLPAEYTNPTLVVDLQFEYQR